MTAQRIEQCGGRLRDVFAAFAEERGGDTFTA
jgi:hypothetical protein